MQARLSPDGRWLALLTSESGLSQVVVQRFPGTGPHIPISADGGEEPVWARGGQHLLYRSHGRIVVATLATTPKFHVIAQGEFMADRYLHAFAPNANYDVSPDGRKLLVVKGAPQRTIVVRSWWTEARDQLAGRPKP